MAAIKWQLLLNKGEPKKRFFTDCREKRI
jgi:hypothetical protein